MVHECEGKNLDPDLEQKEKTKKSGSVGRPTDPDLEQKNKKEAL